MPDKGDIFIITLKDEKLVLGQVIQYDTRGLPCYSIGLFDDMASSVEEAQSITLDFGKCFSLLLATPECLQGKGQWKIIGTQKLVIPKKYLPYEKLRKAKKPGSRLHDKSAIEEFANAYYALLPWDNYYKPDYLDDLLLTPEKKPTNLIYKED